MKDFKRGGGKFAGKKPRTGGFGRKPNTMGMHPATCSECGEKCEVPFKPLPGKKVFCRNCFKKSDETASRRPESPYKKKVYRKESYGGTPTAAAGGNSAKEFAEINAKLDKILATLADLELDGEEEE